MEYFKGYLIMDKVRAIEYALDIIGDLPASADAGTAYTTLVDHKNRLLTRNWFTRLWYKYTWRI